jgi:hypothetical protein
MPKASKTKRSSHGAQATHFAIVLLCRTLNHQSHLIRSRYSHLSLKLYCGLSLLRLPRELRNEIWKYTITEVQTSDDMQVLLSCPQVYHEAQKFAWSSTVFIVDAQYWQKSDQRDAQKLRAAKLRISLTTARRRSIKTIRTLNDNGGWTTLLGSPGEILRNLALRTI